MLKKTLVSIFLVLLAAGFVSAQNKRPLTAEDYYAVRNVGNPVISPDGGYVAFTVQTARKKENDRITRIWMANLGTGRVYPFTSPEHDSREPRWSKDGRYLIFTSDRGTGTTTWHISMEPGSGEAFYDKEYKPEPGNPSPDGQFALFTKSIGGKPAEGVKDSSGDGFDGRIIEHRVYKRNQRGFVPPDEDAGGITQVFRATVGENPDTLQLTSGTGMKKNPHWSADGKYIIYTDNPVQRDEKGRRLEFLDRKFGNSVYVIPAAGGEPQELNIFTEKTGQVDIGFEHDFSHSSNRFLYRYQPERFSDSKYYVYDLATGTSVPIAKDWIYGIRNPRWSPDDTWLYFSANIGGSTHLCRVKSDGSGSVEQVTRGEYQYGSFQFDDDMTFMVYTKTSATFPGELFMADIDGGNERQLSHINDEFLNEVYLNPVHRHIIDGKGGLKIEGWVMEPTHYDPGKQYPLVLQIHGGPHSRYGNVYFQQFHLLAAQDMFVVFINPRGSGGYGYDFAFVTREKWGVDDYDDYMRFVDFVIENYPIDTSRLGVGGGSYGGFMTAWITTKTNRFSAATCSRMISNWWSFFGTSDAQGLIVNEFGFGMPWDERVGKNMWKFSPIAHVQNVTTPTLIIQSEEDYRTPMPEAEQWFQALKIRGVPTRFVRYPRENHELSRSGEPHHLVHRLNEIKNWFVTYLKENKQQ